MSGNSLCYVFGVHDTADKNHDRALLMRYSVMRSGFSAWKICTLKYLDGGKTDIDSQNPSFKGNVQTNVTTATLFIENTKDKLAECKWETSVPNLKEGELGAFHDLKASKFFTLKLYTIRPGGDYDTAYLPQGALA